MVDVPFVSEEFQRAFRNTFKGQVNSGRDLHVSDVVIPVVDFTPTASTTSIPFDLLTSRNRNTGGIAVTSTSASTDVTTQTGFFRLSTTFKATNDSFINFFFDDGSATFSFFKMNCQANQAVTSEFFVYNRVGDKIAIQTDLGAGTGEVVVFFTPIADVNGDLIQPSGYDPQ